MAIAPYISKTEISKRVQELAEMINRDFAGQEVLVVGVLQGAFIFCADLLREIKVPVLFDFVALSSYEGTESTGQVKMKLDLKHDVYARNVIVIEDIVDTGLTMSYFLNELKSRQPKKLKLCSLLLKRSRLKVEVPIDYLGFDIEDKFVIGYGLDYDGRYRELPYIGVYSEN